MTLQIGIVGDVHGEVARLRSVLALARPRVERFVFVGDYVDRGRGSAGVIQTLIDLRDGGVACTFLAGNHDRAMLAALGDDGFDAFLQLGGAATVRSYVDRIDADVARQFRRAVPPAHAAFLAALGTAYEADRLLVVHARPDVDATMAHGRFVVCGHLPQGTRRPWIGPHGANVDTGCGLWPDGPLTCLLWPSLDWLQA